MKRNTFRVILFVLFIIGFDQSLGLICRYLNSHAKSGDTAKHYYIAEQCNEDILIFGSSRAEVTYDPQIIKDSLEMTAYNCGSANSSILLQYGRLKMITQRYCPKLVILDMTTFFDIYKSNVKDEINYIQPLKKFYDRPGIDSLFSNFSRLETLKMNSQLYRFNGYLPDMIIDYLTTDTTKNHQGYKPIFDTIDYEPDSTDLVNEALVWDSTKKLYFQKFINICKEKGIVLVVAYSPIYRAKSSVAYSEVTNYCLTHNIPLIDYYANQSFVSSREWFADILHMNAKGGKKYTAEIIAILRKVLNDSIHHTS